jgi:hypothetical protein
LIVFGIGLANGGTAELEITTRGLGENRDGDHQASGLQQDASRQPATPGFVVRQGLVTNPARLQALFGKSKKTFKKTIGGR